MFTRSEAGKLGYEKTQAKLQEQRAAQIQTARVKYEENAPRCGFCGTLIPYEKRANKFCNHSCAASFTNLGVAHNPRKSKNRTHCLRCNERIIGTGKVYCSRQCSHKHRGDKFKEQLLNNSTQISYRNITAIRKCLIRMRGERCEKCGWAIKHCITGRVPLEVDHIDGNYENNAIANLKLLCPNCHSLTPTYRNLNKGKGRESRRKRADIAQG